MKESFFENRPDEEKLSPDLQEIVNKQEYVRKALEEIKNFDKITYDHTIEVANLISAICEKIGLTAEESALLTEAALVHDIGKTKIDPEILFKKGKLSEEDWAEVRKHVYYSFQYISESGRPEVAKIAVAHHDHDGSKSASRFDAKRRSGDLPVDKDERVETDRRERDDRQVKLSRILAIADNFESLRSKRQYKESFAPEECQKILMEKFTDEEDQKIIEELLKLDIDKK